MRKGVSLFVILLTLVISLSFIHADEASDIEKAYQCLQNQITSKGCSAMTTEERAFSLLALPDFEVCLNELNSSTGTTIKQKALSLLALNSIGKNTTAIEDYLLSQKTITTGMTWYLQVETDGAASCEVAYDNQIYSFSIAANKKLSGNPGNCLSISHNKSDYWFLFNSNSGCLEKTYEISCNGEGRFLTNLLYQETGSQTIFVSSDTHIKPSGEVTSEKITSYCFKQQGASGVCDYEGSLWATYALDRAGNDVRAFIPYLKAKASSNSVLLPEAILYYLTEDSVYTDGDGGLFKKQGKFQNNYFWSQSGDKFYDTAFALLPFRGDSLTQKTNAKSSLINARNSNNGCWGDSSQAIKDTAFTLYSVWPELSPDAPQCSNNATCVGLLGTGAYCNNNGTCIAGSQQGCTSNATCVASLGAGAYCSNGVCYEPQDTTCTTNSQCVSEHGAGWVCNLQTNECILQSNVCQGDSQCTNDDLPRCVSGACKQCQPSTETSDCGSEQQCIDNICKDRPDIVAPYCGDGNISKPNSHNFTEFCDLTNMGPATSCSIFGFNNQTRPPSCYSNCTVNITSCFNSPVDECSPTKNCTGVNSTCQNGHCVPPPSANSSICGNGIAEPGEACDGSDWRVITSCTNISGYDKGNLSCIRGNSSSSCQFNTSLCYSNTTCIENKDCAYKGTGYECVYGSCLPPITKDECDNSTFCKNKYGNNYQCVYGDCKIKNDGTDDLPDCEDDFQYFCRSNNACLSDDGEVLDQYSCSSSSGVCCSKDTVALTCADQSGEICNSEQICAGGSEITNVGDLDYGESCCVGGTCEDRTNDTSDCEWYGGSCKVSCSSSETQNNDDCVDVYGSGYVCCVSGSSPPPDEGGSLAWLWILLFLIVIVVLAILFRDKLRIALMKMRSGKEGPKGRPGFPPPGMMSNRPIPRRIMPPMQQPPQRPMPQRPAQLPPPQRPMPPRAPPPQKPAQKPSDKEKPKQELDDVLKKLKEMGK